MLSRCDSRHGNYTELCNRSSTSSLGLIRPIRPTCDMLEDYWEDASVSLRSCHSWEASPTPWLNTPSSPVHDTSPVADGSCKGLSSSGSGPIWPRSRSFDANEYVASHKAGRRSFPPPLASCSTLSIKEGGRFVLKEMDADRPQGFFRAQRGNGRLRLELILPDEVDDEEDDQEEVSSSVEDMVKWSPGDHNSHLDETTSGSDEESFAADEDGMDATHLECDVSNIGKEVGFLELDSYLANNLLTFGKLELDQFAADGNSNIRAEQESLWNVDARQQALANLNPWSPNQMCVHPSIAHIRPALGLAMS